MANELKQYLDRVNAFNKIFGDREYDLNNAVDRRRLAEKLDGDLSPENLTCDGELSRSEVNRRYTLYTRAQKQLEALEKHERAHSMMVGGPFPIAE